MNKKYLVSVYFDGIIEYEVEANNDTEAREEAEAMFNEEDARNLYEMSGIKVPILCLMIGEGGSGAGFPGVPLAIACPEAQVTLLDSLGKRITWLKEILPQLGIQAECVTARAEEAVASCRESYDIATSRAVARLNILLELLAPYVKVGGAVVALKGSAAKEELGECGDAMKKLGLRQEAFLEFPVDGASHALIVLRKVAPTPKAYPRRYAKIKQSPL